MLAGIGGEGFILKVQNSAATTSVIIGVSIINIDRFIER